MINEKDLIAVEEDDLVNGLSDEEILILTKIRHIRENIQNYIDMNDIIEYMKRLVDESKYFSFTSNRSKKYISPDNPIFYLKINNFKNIEIDYKHKFSNFQDENGNDLDLDIVARCLQEDVISKFVDILTELVFESDKLNDIFNKNELYLTNKVKKIFKDTEMITFSSVFYNLADLKNNNIRVAFVS